LELWEFFVFKLSTITLAEKWPENFVLVSQSMSQILADVCSAEISKHEYLEKSSNNTNTIVTCSCGLVGVFQP
jgi:hypothetical protein